MDRPGPAARPHGRDDSWSDAATAALIDAWGDRYLLQNRGILRLKDWKEIADAVNGGDNAAAAAEGEEKKPPRIWSDVQCKNRVDTLKKKYKLERSKPSPSPWPFFHRLDFLIGGASPAGNGGDKKKKKKLPIPALPPARADPVPASPPESSIGDENEDDVAARELARALVRLGEVYERIERSKQRTVMELERQRIEFSKEIEFQRLNMLVDFQLEMERTNKNKRTKLASASTSGKK